MTINVYEQAFAAECTANSVFRHAALVMLISTSEQGTIRYEAAVTFFPHNDEEDFAISYDAYYSDVLYAGNGRRSKKREALLMEALREKIDALAKQADGVIFWDQPLYPARLG